MGESENEREGRDMVNDDQAIADEGGEDVEEGEEDGEVTLESVRLGWDLFKEWQEVYDSLPPHSAWNQQSPLSRKLAKEGRLVAIIREMTGDNGLNSDGDVVIEAVRRAEEEEVRSLASTFCSGSPGECGSAERFRRIDGAYNNLARPQAGAAGRELQRLLPPTYRDGLGLPRGARGLPGARKVSASLHHESGDPKTNVL